jgi:hypothetical protein
VPYGVFAPPTRSLRRLRAGNVPSVRTSSLGTAAQQVVAGTTGEGVVSGAAVKPVRGRLENVHGLRRFFSLICTPIRCRTASSPSNRPS